MSVWKQQDSRNYPEEEPDSPYTPSFSQSPTATGWLDQAWNRESTNPSNVSTSYWQKPQSLPWSRHERKHPSPAFFLARVPSSPDVGGRSEMNNQIIIERQIRTWPRKLKKGSPGPNLNHREKTLA